MFMTSEVFDTYWRFAALRQAAYESRQSGEPGPWTEDPIIARHRFTNCFRSADRVSQFLIREVAYKGSQDPSEIVLRTLLFKFFNKIETWEAISEEFGTPNLRNFDVAAWSSFLVELSQSTPIYSAAYVIPQPPLGAERKATNHLILLRRMLDDGLAASLTECGSLKGAYETLRAYPGLGDFLAFQFAIDLNYTTVLNFDEMDFVVAGPGARDGVRKCFGPSAAGHEAAIIRYMSDSQEEHFSRLGLAFRGLGGRRRLMLIDCQNLFCEVDKYARVAHPDVAGISGRHRIKQVFHPRGSVPKAWFPPKWGINEGV